jgi:hypothetical protein
MISLAAHSGHLYTAQQGHAPLQQGTANQTISIRLTFSLRFIYCADIRRDSSGTGSMQPMRNLLFIIVLILLVFVCANDTRATVVMDWASIGYAGNAGDPLDPSLGVPPTPITFGAVNYNYQISKYDVTNNQYVEFLNDKDPTGANTLGLYTAPSRGFGGIAFDPTAASGDKYSSIAGRGTMPVNYVGVYSALRFTNWLNNGQGNANTESGAYTLLGGTRQPSNASAIARSSDAHIVLPTENEWYKAAYYNPATATYFAYPGSNTPPRSQFRQLEKSRGGHIRWRLNPRGGLFRHDEFVRHLRSIWRCRTAA